VIRVDKAKRSRAFLITMYAEIPRRQDEMQFLQDAADRLEDEKQELEAYAETDVNAMRMSEQSQKELNSVQTENGVLKR
jgi:hypothetical protein